MPDWNTCSVAELPLKLISALWLENKNPKYLTRLYLSHFLSYYESPGVTFDWKLSSRLSESAQSKNLIQNPIVAQLVAL